jgi:hypothetical protein
MALCVGRERSFKVLLIVPLEVFTFPQINQYSSNQIGAHVLPDSLMLAEQYWKRSQNLFRIKMLLAAKFLFVMMNDAIPLTQGRRGMENVLARFAVGTESRKKRSVSDHED